MLSDHLYREHVGNTPVLVNVPHAGTGLADGMAARLTETGQKLPDTDWHVDRLYGFAADMGVSLLVARYSRYMVDLNRPPDDHALYAGRGSALVPVDTFSAEPLYRSGQQPDDAEKNQRVENFWAPYHAHLQQRLDQIREHHGHVILLDAHSIRSEVPALFKGELPVLNLGTDDSASASQDIIHRAKSSLDQSGYSLVKDARFKGGYITRHYGQPNQNQHALQLEIAQRSYMQEQPPAWDQDRAATLQRVLAQLLECLLDWRPDTSKTG